MEYGTTRRVYVHDNPTYNADELIRSDPHKNANELSRRQAQHYYHTAFESPLKCTGGRGLQLHYAIIFPPCTRTHSCSLHSRRRRSRFQMGLFDQRHKSRPHDASFAEKWTPRADRIIISSIINARLRQ